MTSIKMPTLVVYGNCQAAAVANMLRTIPDVTSTFEVFHHFVSNEECEPGAWRNQIERLGAIVVQRVENWERYPYRDRLPSGVKRIGFPFLYLGSLWPFDCTQNPDDTVAQKLRARSPNWDFAYQDSVLARLRCEISDHEARFRAYRDMSYTDAVNINRYHDMEALRLRRDDRKHGQKISEFILDNFRTTRLFHTITHPSLALMQVLVDDILLKLGIPKSRDPIAHIDSLRYYQVPIHPKVIDALDLQWANKNTQYQFYDRTLDFETYYRKYITLYG